MIKLNKTRSTSIEINSFCHLYISNRKQKFCNNKKVI